MFQDFKPATPAERAVTWVGKTAGKISGVTAVPLFIFRPRAETRMGNVLLMAWGIPVVIVLLSFTFMGITQMGRKAGKATFGGQLLAVCKHLFVWIFLPSLVLTGLIMLYAWLAGYLTMQ